MFKAQIRVQTKFIPEYANLNKLVLGTVQNISFLVACLI